MTRRSTPAGRRSIVLLSGGLDSTVNLWRAARDGSVELAMTFDYGQRAAAREVSAARRIARRCGVRHKVLKLDWLRAITKTALVNKRAPLPDIAAGGLESAGADSARSVWVPNRNAVFINIAAAHAEALGCGEIVVGFNAEEGATFPDNTPEYLSAANTALGFSTLAKVRVRCYTTRMSKPEIVRLARRLDAPLELIWFCYRGGRRPCWRCETCVRFCRALEVTGNWEWYGRLTRR